ncbi:MAG: TonB-dependent receptor [Saprospiraceae bacterium]|nr:TonB-dependent receptor [Saprospiraceae bacterium]
MTTCILAVVGFSGFSQSTLNGNITNQFGDAIQDAKILVMPLDNVTSSDEKGNFSIGNIPFGNYNLSITHPSCQPFVMSININKAGMLKRRFVLQDSMVLLQNEVSNYKNEITALPSLQGTAIYAGKKTTVINLKYSNANLVENNPRQIFAKVPGVMVWEMDGTGNQISIATRGLNPNRSGELNVRQNGDVINSDLFGSPEVYYTPPSEAVERIEIVRGAGALQYGPQFGGMMNYVIKEPDTTKAINFETKQTVGSFGLFSTFNALGGKSGKFTYYAYYNFRRSNGWRENSDYRFNAWHTSVAYQIAPGISLKASLSHMHYLNHLAGGLTDAMFKEDPRQSNRARDYFKPTIYVPSLHFSAKFTKNTLLTVQASGVLGERGSVQFNNVPTVLDTIDTFLGSLQPRQVDRDYYHSYSMEAKLSHSYSLLNGESSLAVGVRYGDSRILRKEKALGTTGSDFDLSLFAPYVNDLIFRTHNYAAFTENMFNITQNFSVTPGFRLEYIKTDMTGSIINFQDENVPKHLSRYVPLFGIGTEYKINHAINAYCNFTQNFRPILHSDLIPTQTSDEYDPNLKDARGYNFELGARGYFKRFLQFEVNYFKLVYNDRIGPFIKGNTVNHYSYQTNISDILNQGAEIFIEFHPLRLVNVAVKDMDISLFTSTAYTSAHYIKGFMPNTDVNTTVKGNDVEYTPHWISRNGIHIKYHALTATVQASYVSLSYSDSKNTPSTYTGVNGRVPSYLITDFNLSYEFWKRYSIQCAIGNLTDEHYFTRRSTGHPGPGLLPSDGRSFLVSVGAKF